MRTSSQRRDWDDLAGLDPYWAILSDPDKRLQRWDEREFFATGTNFIGALMTRAASLGVPDQYHVALDFGCGVGRLTQALARHFDRTVGIDISSAMIRRARALNSDPACEFQVVDGVNLDVFQTDSFDYVGSFLVLQHIGDARVIERLLLDFARLLKPGGLLVFQLPSLIPLRRRLQPRRRAYGLLRALRVPEHTLYRHLGLYPIRMASLGEARVARLLDGAGMSILQIDHGYMGATGIEDRTYWATKHHVQPDL